MKKSSPIISVIVPIYKAEKYIYQCLDSLLNQTMSDFELLLIDDGSPDRSGEICDEYARKDNRIRVFHKNNGGVASARKMGIDNAKGEYSIHVDPDDWVEPTMLEDLYMFAKAHNSDMVICDYYEKRNDGEYYVSQKPKSYDPSNIVIEMFEGSLHGSCCNKLVRCNIIIQNKVSFPSLSLCEDTYFNLSLLLHSIKIDYLSKAFYHYNKMNVNSVTRGGNPQTGLYAYEACCAFRKLIGANMDFWSIFVTKEMPWMAYLSLYYGSVNSKQYYCAFHELSCRIPQNSNEKLTRYAINHYLTARVIIQIRKKVGFIRKLIIRR